MPVPGVAEVSGPLRSFRHTVAVRVQGHPGMPPATSAVAVGASGRWPCKVANFDNRRISVLKVPVEAERTLTEN